MEKAQFVNDGKRTAGFRCGKCGRLLSEGGKHKIMIRCDRCGTLNRVLEKILEQVIITDKTGKILYVNKEVEDITGYSVDEVLGKSPSLWGGQMPKKFYKQMWDTLLTQKETVSVNITNKHKSGHLYKVNLTISPVLDTTGEVVFLVGMEKLIPEPEK